MPEWAFDVVLEGGGGSPAAAPVDVAAEAEGLLLHAQQLGLAAGDADLELLLASGDWEQVRRSGGRCLASCIVQRCAEVAPGGLAHCCAVPAGALTATAPPACSAAAGQAAADGAGRVWRPL